MHVLACVVNVSEGRRPGVVARVAEAAGADLLDVHTDGHHHRSVLWLVGEEAARSVAVTAVACIDLRRHTGAHPRLGAVDVVPFVPLAGATLADAVAARDRFVAWVAGALGVPAFAYGEERPLPEVRRRAYRTLRPDAGPVLPHPTAGAVAVGARPALVAYNLWLDGADLAAARAVARGLRGPLVRALGLRVGAAVQVSLNLLDPVAFGPAAAHDAVTRAAGALGVAVARAELVGLMPAAVLERVPEARWHELDLGPDRTVESRLAARWGGGGRPAVVPP
jgi:glutamate formiminotransferase